METISKQEAKTWPERLVGGMRDSYSTSVGLFLSLMTLVQGAYHPNHPQQQCQDGPQDQKQHSLRCDGR
jgi:hypothetical protein